MLASCAVACSASTTFFALLCTYLLLSMMLPSEAKWPLDQGARAVYVIENLLLMPGMFDIVPMMTVAWTLSYEVFYYALIPIIVGGFGMARGGRRRGC